MGKWRACAGLQVLVPLGHVLAAEDVQLLLPLAHVFELRALACAGRGEEFVQVELIELAAAGNGQQLVRHLVSQESQRRSAA